LINRKVFRIIWISVAGLIALYVLALMVITIIANKEKAKFLVTINNALKENLQGDAVIKDIELNAWRHFPSIEVRLTGVSLSDTLYHRPLLSAASISTTIGIFQMLRKNKTVNNIEVKDGVFHLFTDSTGYNNNYLLKPKKKPEGPPKEASNNSIYIKHISVENTLVLIEDHPKNKKIEFTVNDLDADLEKKDSILPMEVRIDCKMKTGLGFDLSKGAYLENATLGGKWKLELNTASKTLSFDKMNVEINKHDFELTGAFNFAGEQLFSIGIVTKDVQYKEAAKVVTAAIRKKLDMFDLEKPINVNGVIKGSLLPGQPYVNMSWEVKNNVLKTPVAAFSSCSFSGNFMNEVVKDSSRNDANSRIVFTDFTGDWDGIKLKGKEITVNDLENSTLHFNLESYCGFDALDRKFALNTIRFVNGTAELNLKYDGPLKTGREVVENVNGSLHIKNGEVQYIPRDFTFTNCSGNIYFLEDSISLQKLQCDYKGNHFEVEVNGRNIRKKLMQEDSANATLTCNVFSPAINFGDFKTLFATPEKHEVKRKADKVKFSQTSSAIDDILEKGSLQVNLKANSLKYNNLEASNVQAGILFRQHNWSITNLFINMAGGTLSAKGNIRQVNSKYHEATLSTQMKGMNVQKAFYAFDDFGQDAITSKNIRGVLNTDANIKLGINNSGNIIPSSMHGAVNFSLRDGALVNFKPIMNVKNFVLANKDLSNIKFAELKDRLEIEGDKLYISRMEIESTALSMFIEGVYGFKGNSDLLLQLPLSNLEVRDKSYVPKNIGVNGKVGPSVRVRASSGDDGKMKFNITFSKKVKGKKEDKK